MLENRKNQLLQSGVKNLLYDGVLTRDSVGATIFHVAYLFKHYEIGRWLVKKYPREALQPFSDKFPPWLLDLFPPLKKEKYAKRSGFIMPYSGETILHMTIIRRYNTHIQISNVTMDLINAHFAIHSKESYRDKMAT